MEIFKKLTSTSNSVIPKKAIYISHDGSKEIQYFLKDLNKKLIQYSIKYRESDAHDYKIEIENASLVIWIVTPKYFQSEHACEFEYAIDSNKTILFLISSQTEEFENKDDDDDDVNHEINRYSPKFTNIIKTYSILVQYSQSIIVLGL